jgi:hypothetical protein
MRICCVIMTWDKVFINRCGVCSAILTRNASREARYSVHLKHNCHIFHTIWETKTTCLILPLHMSLHKEHRSANKFISPLIFINIEINDRFLTFVFSSHHSLLDMRVPTSGFLPRHVLVQSNFQKFYKIFILSQRFLSCFWVYYFPIATKIFSLNSYNLLYSMYK